MNSQQEILYRSSQIIQIPQLPVHTTHSTSDMLPTVEWTGVYNEQRASPFKYPGLRRGVPADLSNLILIGDDQYAPGLAISGAGGIAKVRSSSNDTVSPVNVRTDRLLVAKLIKKSRSACITLP